MTQVANTTINGTTGFLPKPDPLQKLPADFELWDELGRELPKLLIAGKVRATVDAMPLLDTTALVEDSAVRRAMMVLSFLGHGYVWGLCGATAVDSGGSRDSMASTRGQARSPSHPILRFLCSRQLAAPRCCATC